MSEVTTSHYGVTFELYDLTELVFTAPSYLYMFTNKGERSGMAPGYIEDHHLTKALVAAPTFVAAIEMLSEDFMAPSYGLYEFEVSLMGIDLMPSEGTRVIYTAIE